MHFVYITSVNTMRAGENDRYVKGEISQCISPSIMIEISSKVVWTVHLINRQHHFQQWFAPRCWQAFNCTNDRAAE